MAQHNGSTQQPRPLTPLPTPLSLLCHGSAAAHSGDGDQHSSDTNGVQHSGTQRLTNLSP
ncbi:unnamed protein product, partial [Ilex paraguariensis]